MLLAVGEARVDDFSPKLAKMGTGFGGGIGRSADLCGAVAAGVMLIGLLHGRVALEENETVCARKSRKFHDRFADELGFTICYDFTKGKFRPAMHKRCEAIVEKATRILLEVLDD